MVQSLHAENIEYKDGDLLCEGTLVYDGSSPRRRPGVLVAHSARGLDAYARRRAAQLARAGYVAFALDICGKDSAGAPEALEKRLLADRALLRRRAEAGLKALRYHRLVESRRIGVVGYSFGGAAALELARGGEDLRAVVTFHGILAPGAEAPQAPLAAKILVLHGADDPRVSPEQIAAFQDEMRRAGAEWEMVIYGGAVHGFSNPDSGSDRSKGVAYDERADRRSWSAMSSFLDDVLK
jgi:dienelactone hydrolase